MSTTVLDPSIPIRTQTATPGEVATEWAHVERERLDALTALRFLAAALIVLLHTRGAFGLPADWGGAFQFAQAVPFFFMLSGFILTHVYRQLDEVGTRRYLAARFARLWPAHAATFLMTVMLFWIGVYPLLPGDSVPAALANLAMVHSWVPDDNSYFSFNSPSWSISAELAFYLLFPLLIRNWRRTWLAKLLLALVLMRVMDALPDLLDLPTYQLLEPGMDRAGLTSVSPLVTLYLFVLGMTSFLLWEACASRLRMGTTVATVMEVAALAFTAWTLAVPRQVWTVFALAVPSLGMPMLPWMPAIPTSIVAFLVLIVVMALGQGLVSRALSFPLFVLLGEMSYSLYLVHVPMKIAFFPIDERLASVPDSVVLALYWLSTLMAALVLWWCVERPSRSFLRGWYLRHEHALSDGQWRAVGAAAAAAVLLILIVHILTLR